MGSFVSEFLTKRSKKNDMRERKHTNLDNEDFLISQIDEFKEKARELTGLLAAKEEKVKELQKLVEIREGKAEALAQLLNQRQEQADQIVEGVQKEVELLSEKFDSRIGEMNEKFAEKMAETAESSIEIQEEMRTLIQEQKEAQKQAADSISGLLEQTKIEIFDKIHTEDVMCYRNIQSLMEESSAQMKEIHEEVKKATSQRGLLLASLVFSVLGFLGIAGSVTMYFLYAYGII